MNNYKINPDYALPEGLAIGMEGTFKRKTSEFKGTLQGFFPGESKKFAANNVQLYDEFIPIQPWQPEPGDRRTGELVWCWNFRSKSITLARYSSYADGVYYAFNIDCYKLAFHRIAKVYDIDKEFGMTIQEIIDSRKPGDVLGGI